MSRRRKISLAGRPVVNKLLRCGWLTEAGHCALDKPLSGSALNSLLLFLDREGLVRVDWIGCGGSVDTRTSIGTITAKGREAYERGYLD
ncbi:MAG: hypothetical protein OXN96_19200 [Bryobacterales bacterium]|nr:hypothetical protein [Bryobacterales bacterium]